MNPIIPINPDPKHIPHFIHLAQHLSRMRIPYQGFKLS